MNKKLKLIAGMVFGVIVLFPFNLLAQLGPPADDGVPSSFINTSGSFTRTGSLISGLGGLVNTLILVVAALALLYFFWGLAKFILNAASEDAQKEGKNIMKWGIVALFVMVSIWGIVRFIGDELKITNNTDLSIPGFKQTR